ncbi:MAG: 3-oxoacyl-ACP synthase, partial [Vicinamibacterales bacterium]
MSAADRPRAEIVGIEYALPDRVCTNEDLQREFPSWDMTAVERKTGVRRRHIAGPDECASDLAYTACERLFEATGVPRESIDGLVVCTQTPDYVLPATSALLQRRLGLPVRLMAFDYTLACSGFVYGLAMCRAFVESELLRTVILVTCDTYSKYIRPDDRSTRTLFGDGAAATLIRAGREGIGTVEL